MESSSASSAATEESSFLGRRQFLIYRLFSLAGLVPIGAYMVVHLITNSTILDSPGTFQGNVDQIHSLGIFLPVVEWMFIFIPIMFHAAVGGWLISGMAPNTIAYPFARNRRYLFQRVTGIIAFFFIFAHVMHLHHMGSVLPGNIGGQFEPDHASSSAAKALQANLWIQLFYAVGVIACSYHLANGLWTQGLTWGIWISPRAQRRATFFSVAVGLLVATVGLSALWGMRTVNIEKAERIENNMLEFKRIKSGRESLESAERDAMQKSDAGSK